MDPRPESGGGGYGDPLTRPVDQVAEDLRDGWVTVDAARELYGVVASVGERPGDVDVDVKATETLRNKSNER